MVLDEQLEELDKTLSYLSAFIDGKLPGNVFSKKEIALSIVLTKRIAKLKGKIIEKEKPNKLLKNIFGSNQAIKDFVQSALELCNLKDLDKFQIKLGEEPGDDILGRWLQYSLHPDIRKKLAANYTRNSVDLLNYLLQPEQCTKDHYSLADPFCGSGRLIRAYLYFCSVHGLDYPDKIMIGDIMPTAVLIAYFRLVAEFPKIETRIKATIGNGFSFSSKADIVLVNPPFTRSQLISDDTKKYLEPLYKQYAEFNTGKAGLHFWAVLFLIQQLTHDGILIAILPQAIISSSYSTALFKELLQPNVDVVFSTSKFSKAHSEDSDLKEIALLYQNSLESGIISFQRHDEDFQITNMVEVMKVKLKEYWNWSIFFRDQELVHLAMKMVNKLKLVSVEKLDITIKRGIEMYGPNFFFLPNRHFTLHFANDSVVVSDGKNEFSFLYEYVETIMRKPSKYKQNISPTPQEYCLKLPKSLNPTIREYIDYHGTKATVAEKRFGKEWYNHISHQLATKQPYGHIFLVDKLDLTSTPTLAYYTDEKLPCTKNFYVLQIKNSINPIIVAAWLNSTLYLLLYLAFRREIGGTYGRLQIIDYYNLPLFLPRIWFDNEVKHQHIISAFNQLRNQPQPPLSEQIDLPEKLKLDQAWIDTLGIDISVEELHRVCKSMVDLLSKR